MRFQIPGIGDLLMYALCIGTIIISAVFGTWALFMTMSL